MTDKNQVQLTLITGFSAFILGYINAHGVLFDIGVMVSPQTGNLVNMAVSLSAGDSSRFLNTWLIFSGFFLGCMFSTWLVGKIKNKQREFFVTWSIFIGPIFLNWLFIDYVTPRMAMLGLSFISGVGLCFFRKVGKLEINNNIVTGNMRFMGGALFEVLFRRDQSKVIVFWSFTLITFLFFLGALSVGFLAPYLGRSGSLLFVVLVGMLPYFLGLGLEAE